MSCKVGFKWIGLKFDLWIGKFVGFGNAGLNLMLYYPGIKQALEECL